MTRPPMISGKPVKSPIDLTGTPASLSSRAVPPVETISTPSSVRPRAKSTIPRLSETDNSARATCTSPGATGWYLPASSASVSTGASIAGISR